MCAVMPARRVFAMLLFLCMCSIKRLIFDKYNKHRLDNNHNEAITYGVNELHIILVKRRINIVAMNFAMNSNKMVKRPHVRWTNHGHLCLCLQDVHPAAELTICMDISSNPGPANITETSLDKNCTNNTSAILQTHKSVCNQSCSFRRVYSRRELWDLKTIPACNNKILNQIKQSGLFRFRGKRAGRRHIRKKYEVNNKSYNIPVIINCDRKSHYRHEHMHIRERNLIPIPRNPRIDQHCINYPMPKCLLINICGLNKTKNRVRAPVALAADMIATDVDICIVSETHLKPDIPDSVVAISNYVLHRRDRNCFGNDKRKGGGVAVYVRSNIHIDRKCCPIGQI